MDRELAVAKELVASQKRERALLALKRRKLHEQRLGQLDAWLLNVEQLVRIALVISGLTRGLRLTVPPCATCRCRGTAYASLLPSASTHRDARCMTVDMAALPCLLEAVNTCELDSGMLAQLSNIEVAKQQNRLFDALKAGSEAVKSLQQQVPPRPGRSRCVLPC